MSSKRLLKRDFQNAISNIVEEAYSYQLFNPGKKDKEVDALIDQAVTVLEDSMEKINSARNLKNGKEVRKHFSTVKADFEKQHEKLFNDVNKLV